VPYFVAWLEWQHWRSAAARLSAPAQGGNPKFLRFFMMAKPSVPFGAEGFSLL